MPVFAAIRLADRAAPSRGRMPRASMPTRATRFLPSSKTAARTLHGSWSDLVVRLAVAARLLQPISRRDVPLGEAGLEGLGVNRQREDECRDECDRASRKHGGTSRGGKGRPVERSLLAVWGQSPTRGHPSGLRLNFWYGRRTPWKSDLVGPQDLARHRVRAGPAGGHHVVLVDAVAADPEAADQRARPRYSGALPGKKTMPFWFSTFVRVAEVRPRVEGVEPVHALDTPTPAAARR